jgi:hypothetical protein
MKIGSTSGLCDLMATRLRTFDLLSAAKAFFSATSYLRTAGTAVFRGAEPYDAVQSPFSTRTASAVKFQNSADQIFLDQKPTNKFHFDFLHWLYTRTIADFAGLFPVLTSRKWRRKRNS